MCQNGRSPDTDRSDTSQDSTERINERLSDFSHQSDMINECINCSQTGQDCPETFIERAHYVHLWRSQHSRTVIGGGSRSDKDGGNGREWTYFDLKIILQNGTLTCLHTVLFFFV